MIQFNPDGFYATRNGQMVVRVVSVESAAVTEFPVICRVHALEEGADTSHELGDRICFAPDGTSRRGTQLTYKNERKSVFDFPAHNGFDLVRAVA